MRRRGRTRLSFSERKRRAKNKIIHKIVDISEKESLEINITNPQEDQILITFIKDAQDREEDRENIPTLQKIREGE